MPQDGRVAVLPGRTAVPRGRRSRVYLGHHPVVFVQNGEPALEVEGRRKAIIFQRQRDMGGASRRTAAMNRHVLRLQAIAEVRLDECKRIAGDRLPVAIGKPCRGSHDPVRSQPGGGYREIFPPSHRRLGRPSRVPITMVVAEGGEAMLRKLPDRLVAVAVDVVGLVPRAVIELPVLRRVRGLGDQLVPLDAAGVQTAGAVALVGDFPKNRVVVNADAGIGGMGGRQEILIIRQAHLQVGARRQQGAHDFV